MRVVMGSRRTSPAAKTSSERTPPSSTAVVTIKQESPEDDIKEYAETAMNELLGWYGYDKVDSRDTQGLNLHHFASSHKSASDVDSSDSAASSPAPRGLNRESPDPLGLPSGCSICAWCQKTCNKEQLFSLKTPTGQKNFCSEICFTQCRRANFKRNKTCDWCRHVRHTVNYVDFQDGEHQLQFCSDKCLNQYKMNIFCRETQAHLQMHPHLQDGTSSGSSGGTLITPDLWMRDCRSESPSSDHSVSPTPSAPPPPPQPPLSISPPPKEQKEVNKCPRRSARSKRTIVSTSTPSDLRTSSSPRSVESLSPPKNSSHPSTPILHSPHLLPPPPPRPPPPYLPHGLLTPPGLSMFHNPRNSPNFPPITRPPRSSPNPATPTRPPPLLPLPLRMNRVTQPPPPPPPPPSTVPPPQRFLMPPVTVMVPYPIILPLPIPIPIPIPFLPPKNSKHTSSPPPAEEKPSSPPKTLPTQVTNAPPPPTPPASSEEVTTKKTTLNNRPLRKRKRLETSSEDGTMLKQKFVSA